MNTDTLMDALGMIEDEIILEAKPPLKNSRRFSKKRTTIFIAAIVLSLTLPALAVATVDPAYQMMYRLSPSLAQALKPVQLSCVDNGIQMEVISASIYENEAILCISMQDLTGDRIDETTDLFDSYRIHRSFDCSASCSRLSFDPQSRTVTFLIHITQWKKRPLEGDKITFSVKEFLSHKQTFDGEITESDLTTVDQKPATRTGVSFVGAGLSDIASLDDKERLDAIDALREKTWLVPESQPIYSPTHGASITSMGYIDGKLHIQTLYENTLETDNHGSVYLVDQKGEKHYSNYDISFFEKEGDGKYEEQVFDIPPDEIGQYKIYGRFITSAPAISGNWQITFPLEDAVS